MSQRNKTIWFDFTNVPHVHFLHPVIKQFSNFKQIYSIRDFAETEGLFRQLIANDYLLIGAHTGRNKLKKTLSVLHRIVQLQRKLPHFDIKISVGGDASSVLAKIRGKRSITFDDNEKAPNWRYSLFSDYAFWPKAIPLDVLKRQGFKESKLFRYNGYKEDIYVSDYKPDPVFMDKIPFKRYVLLRPENLQANYVNKNKTIIPALLHKLTTTGYQVVYLPRYEHDKELAQNQNNVFMPKNALNGLDLCYYADAVLTGAGTLAREAACLNVPSFSFYAGKELLTVDQNLIQEGKVFFSRDPHELVSKLKKSNKHEPDFSKSITVKNEVMGKLKELLG